MPTGKGGSGTTPRRGFGFPCPRRRARTSTCGTSAARGRRGSQGRSAGRVRAGLGTARAAGAERQADRPTAEPEPHLPGGGRRRTQHSPDELHGMVEDMITLLESAVQPELRRAATRQEGGAPGLRGGSRGRQRARRLTVCTAADGEHWVHGFLRPPAASSIATPTTSPPASPRTAGTAIPSSPAGTG